MDIAFWVFLIAAIGSGAYGIFKHLTVQSRKGVSLDKTLRQLTSDKVHERVKESSRILEPKPEMTRPTEAEPADQAFNDGVGAVAYAEQAPAAEPQTGEVLTPADSIPENVPGSAPVDDNFLSGLDEDVKSNYQERQQLSGAEQSQQEETPRDQTPMQEETPRDQTPMPEDIGQAQTLPYEGTNDTEALNGTPSATGGFEDVSNIEETAAEQPLPNGADAASVFDQFEEAFEEQQNADEEIPNKPKPEDLSAAFHRLEEEGTAEHESQADESAEEADDEAPDETDRNDSLFG